jgi:hypothetical protein
VSTILRHPSARLAAIAAVAVGGPVTAGALGGTHPALAAVVAGSTLTVAFAARLIAGRAGRELLGEDNTQATAAGVLRELEHRVSFQGRAWCTAVLETPAGPIPIEVWPKPYALAEGTHLAIGQQVTVSGKVDRREMPAHMAVATVTRRRELTGGRA